MLYWTHEIDSTLIAVWKIEESTDELINMLDEKVYIENILTIKSDKIKQEKLAVRVLLKRLFDKEVELEYNKAGRPYLMGMNMHISITHTKGYAAVALDAKRQIGIDIEHKSDKILRVKDRVISETEYINQADELNHLLLHWCAKESMFKVMDADGVDYQEHLHIEHFTPKSEGFFTARESKSDDGTAFRIYYHIENDFVLTCLS